MGPHQRATCSDATLLGVNASNNSTSLPRPIRDLIGAVNNGDTDAFVGAFDAGGVVDDWGRQFHGHDEIRGWSDRELIGKNSTLDVTGTQTTGDETVVIANVGGDGFNGPSTFTFTSDTHAVSKMAITE